MKNLIKDFLQKFITVSGGSAEISKSREISTTPDRERPAADISPEFSEASPKRLASDSLSCPYCASRNFRRRGFRQKKLERVQLLLCNDCHKTFTPQITKGKHYPLATIFDAVSLYNLGHSLEESCRIVNKNMTQKTTLASGSLTVHTSDEVATDLRVSSLPENSDSVKFGVEVTGIEPARTDFVGQSPHQSTPTNLLSQNQPANSISASTLANWYNQFLPMMPFSRMREYAMKKYSPKNMVVTATLAHRQLYRYRFHRAKCELMISENYKHRGFTPLKEFLEMVPVECPHQYYQDGLRASEAPLTFSKTAMIVRGKTNFATKTAGFVLQSVTERTKRHEAIQKFMLYNDSVTVATEVPVYLTRDDIEHMQTQLGFQIFTKSIVPLPKLTAIESKSLPKADAPIAEADITEVASLPKLITGHIDILQIRNGQIHILDYKPKAEKERPIEQLTLYAMALSRLTGLRLYEFKCGWFDEKDYFEFYPLHVLHKPRKAIRRRRVETMEGTYQVNKEVAKIRNVRPNL